MGDGGVSGGGVGEGALLHPEVDSFGISKKSCVSVDLSLEGGSECLSIGKVL